jgi:hypothetical protein
LHRCLRRQAAGATAKPAEIGTIRRNRSGYLININYVGVVDYNARECCYRRKALYVKYGFIEFPQGARTPFLNPPNGSIHETNRFHALGPHPEEQAFAPEGEGLRLEGWRLAPFLAAILRDASL